MRNFEIKARYSDFDKARKILLELGAEKKEIVYQEDIFLALGGDGKRDKLRFVKGKPVQRVIYSRKDTPEVRPSDYTVEELSLEEAKKLLKNNNPKGKITKKREIWIWKNVRIHLDVVDGLGSFIELESVVYKGISDREAEDRARFLVDKLGIDSKDIQSKAYIDLSNE